MSTFSSSGHGRSTPRHSGNGHHRGHRGASAIRQRRTVTEEHTTSGTMAVLSAALFALPFTVGVGLILLCLTAGLLMSVADPDVMITPLAIGILSVTSLLGGLISARRCGSHALLCGMTAGAFFTLLLWILTLFVDHSDPALTLGVSPWGRVALHAAVVALAGAGGLIGGHQPPKTHRHNR